MDEIRYLSADRTADPAADVSFMSETEIAAVRAFHQSVPGYRATPLRALRELAHDLGLGAVLIKDESTRFGLGAFKGLGAVYAMACILAERLGVDAAVGFPRLRHLVGERLGSDLTFVTATAANHGRGVAWAARQFGCRSVVVIPAAADQSVVEAIRAEGARVDQKGSGFDEAVGEARRLAAAHDWNLLQDTAWQGYEMVPRRILQGYSTMVAESLEQIGEQTAGERLEPPTHVFLQVGVGSFAGAVTAYLVSRSGNPFPRFRPLSSPGGVASPPQIPDLPTSRRLARTRNDLGLVGRDFPNGTLASVLPERLPQIYTAEPSAAAALFASAEAQRPTRLDGCGPTTMTCLACEETSPQAWPILRDWSAGHFACADPITELGQEVLKGPIGSDPRIVSGSSGALGAGLLVALCRRPDLAELRLQLALGPEARVLVFSTEGEIVAPAPG